MTKREAHDELAQLVAQLAGRVLDSTYNVLNSFGHFVRRSGSYHNFRDGMWYKNGTLWFDPSENVFAVACETYYEDRLHELRKLIQRREESPFGEADFMW